MIEIEHLTKRFGSKVAVNDLTLTIPAGELFAFLGPNGAGKTTTIKMIVGLLRPNAGTVRLCGHDMAESPIAAKAQLSYVPDQPYLYDKLTGREFLEFVGRMYGLSLARQQQRIRELTERLVLHDFLDALTEEYSHGMKQRVVIASALLHDPKILVVDEPMVGLDPKTARIVKDILRDLADHGATVFMSIHTLEVAEVLADRIGIIDRGKLIALGGMEELRARFGEAETLEDLFLRATTEEETP